MKKIGEYTVRGRLAAQETAKIQLFDGRFDTAYKIKDFKKWNFHFLIKIYDILKERKIQ